MHQAQETIREIRAVLESSKRFLTVTHINPDGDAIGSLLGMHRALAEMGKESWALSRDKVPALYHFLADGSQVFSEPSHVPGVPDWIISVDVATEPRISGDIAPFRARARLINIDHHPTNPGFGDINLIVPEASSTAEIVFRILRGTGRTISPAVGKCLYTGLLTDTGGFRFAGVNGSTHRMAADMLDTGFDSYEVTRRLYEEHPLQRLLLERLMLERAEILLGGKLVISTLFAEDFQTLGAELSDAENLVDRLRDSRGVEAGILLTRMSDMVARGSLRSKDAVDVSAIAAKFGGGGHRRAAGLRSALPFAQLREEIVQAVKQALLGR